MVDPMPPTLVLLQHDDGRTFLAEVLAQYRIAGRWRVRVRYTTAPGMTDEHARWADELRPIVAEGALGKRWPENLGGGTSRGTGSGDYLPGGRSRDDKMRLRPLDPPTGGSRESA
jgi:hypothetical protein